MGDDSRAAASSGKFPLQQLKAPTGTARARRLLGAREGRQIEPNPEDGSQRCDLALGKINEFLATNNSRLQVSRWLDRHLEDFSRTKTSTLQKRLDDAALTSRGRILAL